MNLATKSSESNVALHYFVSRDVHFLGQSAQNLSYFSFLCAGVLSDTKNLEKNTKALQIGFFLMSHLNIESKVKVL